MTPALPDDKHDSVHTTPVSEPEKEQIPISTSPPNLVDEQRTPPNYHQSTNPGQLPSSSSVLSSEATPTQLPLPPTVSNPEEHEQQEHPLQLDTDSDPVLPPQNEPYTYSSSPLGDDPVDSNVKQPASAPALPNRQSTLKSQTHRRRPSTASGNPSSANATGAHYSRPIEMPPGVPAGGIDTTTVTSNVADLERVHSGNITEFANKLSGSGEQHRNINKSSGSGGNTIKKQITKFSKFTSGAGHRKKVKDGEVVFKGHRNWEIVLSIQFGLRYTSELLEDANGTEPTAKDYEESLAFDFNPIDEQVSKFAKWVHPAPFVYKSIRKRFGVRENDFLDATCSESRVRELPTPGKSGALFYITEDERYFMKTIQHIEEKMLVSMLPSYYKHICENPETLLTRYMAHFSVQTRRDRHIRMVVMESIFNEQIFIDRKYDLKGSTYKRFATPEQLKSENVTLKDQDFNQPIYFRPQVLDKLMNQLEKDSSYLESHQVMDYSLLLGISEMQAEEDEHFKNLFGRLEEDAPYYVAYQKGKSGEKLGLRVSIGIIDFLQRFRLRKKVEYGMRVLQSCSSSSASVAPPHIYRERFMSFLRSRFLPDPDDDFQIN